MNTSRSLIKFTSLFRSTHSLQHGISTLAPAEVKIPSMPAMDEQIHYEIQQNMMSMISQEHHQPKIICHRGRCDIYPQNTIQSITQGMLTSDLVQFDVMLTKDQQVIVFHDRFLGEITNITDHQSFQNRKTVNDLNQFGEIPHSEWWTKQFTLQELKKLSVKQKHVTRPQLNSKQYEIPTFEQIIKKCLQIKSRDPSNTAGILIEIKTQRENYSASQTDKILLQKINNILRKYNLQTQEKCQNMNFPIIVQSFNHEAIQFFHHIAPKLPLTHLYHEQDQNVSQNYIVTHRTQSSIGIAISTKHLTAEFIEACHRMKYKIFYWSVRDDHPQIPLGCSSYQEFYQRLKSMKLDGIITDFANNCKIAIRGLIG